jgi:FkbM family methyltransferase
VLLLCGSKGIAVFLRRLVYYFRSIFTLLAGIVNWPTLISTFIGLPMRKPFTIQLRPSGLRFRVRGPMDIWIIKETCLDRDYERLSRPIQAGWRVIDIGAGLGDFAIDAAQHGAWVCAYEPFPESFDLLKQNLSLNKIEKVLPIAEAVSGRAGTLQLEMSGAAVQHKTTTAAEDKCISVPAITLDKALSRLNGFRCDLLKMDCEGAEYDILTNADEAGWQRIRQIVMEYHDGVTEHSHQDLIDFFEKRGFKTRCFPSQVHQHLGLLHVILEYASS